MGIFARFVKPLKNNQACDSNFGPSPVQYCGALDSIVGPLTTASHLKTLPVLWTIASSAGPLSVLLVPSSIAGRCQYFGGRCKYCDVYCQYRGATASFVKPLTE
jgi:hypothetical protein